MHNGRVLANDLSQQFNVSEDTIRRDLRELAEAGQLQRVHGGGLPHSPAAASYRERMSQASEAKEAIAMAAVQLIHAGQSILLDGGTTTLAVARRIPRDMRLTVITNSPLIATELAGSDHFEIVLIGGRLYQDALVTTGTIAVNTIASMHVDLCMLGVCSLHPTIGVTTPDIEEAAVKRTMIASANQVAALAVADKLDTASTYVVAPITALTYLITERSIPEETLDVYRMAGATVMQA